MDETNPYQAANTTALEEISNAQLAGKWRRFFTWCIDLLCYYVLCLVAGVVLALIFGQSILDKLDGLKGLLLTVPIFFLYYVGFEATLSRTIGKLIIGTKVLSTNGTRPTLKQVFLRTLCRHIPFEPFALFLSDSDVAWHDSIPKTKVVATRE